jgi:hypothetical protein
MYVTLRPNEICVWKTGSTCSNGPIYVIICALFTLSEAVNSPEMAYKLVEHNFTF